MYTSKIIMETCIDNYGDMQYNYVDMQDIYIYMQDNYVYMQDNYVYIITKYFFTQVKIYVVQWKTYVVMSLQGHRMYQGTSSKCNLIYLKGSFGRLPAPWFTSIRREKTTIIAGYTTFEYGNLFWMSIILLW